ncbi:hypothetical protein [Frigoriglobus tundricola]|uniref:Uncharacterized protein n=1 Tax=Frigoriglobus tundricola TaxID=2774151 RepID=A0A6M5YWC4_9BACT|nr:hypothetical protein [Frigoriglobus tundricola]QJW97513.1 hypothetical protein FTUN_5087 [Frigoriglobus tundricola]
MRLSFRRVEKFVVLATLATVVVVGALRLGVGRFLSSTQGKAMVANRLGSALGMPVEVSEINVGDASSSFRFRVMDPADPKAEVLNVTSASADVSAADLVTGRVAPSALKLSGASLTLRVAPDGQVLTPLPPLPGGSGPVPTVIIQNGSVSISQAGRPPFALHGINLKLEPAGPIIALSGDVNDPKWGAWTVRGEVLRDTRTGWVELESRNAPLDAPLLASVPFVPQNLFDEVMSTDRAAVVVRLSVSSDRDVLPAVEIRQTRRIFGIPVEATIRLAPTSDSYLLVPLP